MFQLLQPIWLFALAGLTIPVMIHLWNRRPGRILKVGSIALVQATVLVVKRRLQLSQLLLLLLRCLLLACIALALAAPLWHRPQINDSKGWVLMSRHELASTYRHFKPQVDSLLHAGMAFHYFEEGFKADRIEQALEPRQDTGKAPQTSYRAIANLLNQQADARLPIYVFTDNYLRHFGGERMPVSLNLHWFTYTADTATGFSRPDTATLQVTIFNRAYPNDNHYLKAALQAIVEFGKRNIAVKEVTETADIPAQQDWLFWLDDTSPGQDKAARNILQYIKGKPAHRKSFILPGEAPSFAAINLFAAVADSFTTKDFFKVCWQDGFGNPLLTVSRGPQTFFYKLYTHFDPAWNDLPWNDQFPVLLYRLLYAGDAQLNMPAAADKTIIDDAQALPIVNTGRASLTKTALFTDNSLSGLCWFLAFSLFFAERCLSFYHQRQQANG